MKQSERMLLTIFAVVFGLIVGGGVLTYFFKTYNKIAAERDRLEARFGEMTTALAMSSDWQKRSDWLEQNTPKFGSNEQASSKLFEMAQKEAGEASLKIAAREMIPQRVPGEGESVGYFDKATVKLTFTEVQEQPFFKWLYNVTMAHPKALVGVTRLVVSPSPAGKSINAEVELTQFYAQSNQPKLTRVD